MATDTLDIEQMKAEISAWFDTASRLDVWIALIKAGHLVYRHHASREIVKFDYGYLGYSWYAREMGYAFFRRWRRAGRARLGATSSSYLSRFSCWLIDTLPYSQQRREGGVDDGYDG